MTRKYELKARAEQQDDTRRRIVEATVALHVEIGPVRTQISQVAKRAGVDRVTIYRHFPDTPSLFKACSEHYYSAHPPPDPTRWADVAEPQARLGRGLSEIYGYYRDNAAMCANIVRDSEVLGHLGVGRRLHVLRREATDVLAKGWPVSGERQSQLTAAIKIAVAFHTWRTLTDEQRMSDEAAIDLMATWIHCLTRAR